MKTVVIHETPGGNWRISGHQQQMQHRRAETAVKEATDRGLIVVSVVKHGQQAAVDHV